MAMAVSSGLAAIDVRTFSCALSKSVLAVSTACDDRSPPSAFARASYSAITSTTG